MAHQNLAQVSPLLFISFFTGIRGNCPAEWADDKIRVLETDAEPITEVFGIDVYKGIHENSKQWVYFTTGEIVK